MEALGSERLGILFQAAHTLRDTFKCAAAWAHLLTSHHQNDSRVCFEHNQPPAACGDDAVRWPNHHTVFVAMLRETLEPGHAISLERLGHNMVPNARRTLGQLVRSSTCGDAALLTLTDANANRWTFAAVREQGDRDFNEQELDFFNLAGRQIAKRLRSYAPASSDVTDARAAQDSIPSSKLAKLSRTERDVLHALVRRLTEKQIAEHMHRSPHTIHVHVKSIYRKLDVNSRMQLISLVGDQLDGPSLRAI